MINVGDIVEVKHIDQKYHGVVIEISGEYCYVCLFDKSINFNSSIPYHHTDSSIPYHHTALTILSSVNDVSQPLQ